MKSKTKKKTTRKEKVETHLFPRVRTYIRAGVVNFGAPNGGEEEVIWSWNEPNMG